MATNEGALTLLGVPISMEDLLKKIELVLLADRPEDAIKLATMLAALTLPDDEQVYVRSSRRQTYSGLVDHFHRCITTTIGYKAEICKFEAELGRLVAQNFPISNQHPELLDLMKKIAETERKVPKLYKIMFDYWATLGAFSEWHAFYQLRFKLALKAFKDEKLSEATGDET